MSYKGTTVGIHPGKQAPDAFWESITKDFPSGAGFATAVEVDGVKYIKQFAQMEFAPVSEIKQLVADYNTGTAILYFANFPEGASEHSMQPFPTVRDKTDDLVMVTFMDGQFEDRIVEGSNESGELATHEEFIVDAFKRIFKGANSDVDEFMEEVKSDPSIPKTMNLLYKGRATITMLASNGEYVSFGTNALHTTYDWGWCSNPGSYKETADPVEEPKPEKKPSLLDKARAGFSGRGPAASKPATPTTTGAPPQPLPDKVVKAPDAATSTVLHSQTTEELVGPPGHLTTKNEVQAWYVEHNGGVIPGTWKNRTKIVDQKPEKNAMTKALADVKPVDQSKFKKEVETELLPVISPASLTYVKDVFLKKGSVQKIISDGKVVLDPKRVQQTEAEYVTALEAAGLEGYYQLYGVEQQDWAELIEKAPDFVRVLLFNLLYEDYKVQKAMEGMSMKIEDKPKIAATAAAAADAVKRGGFSNRKVG